MANTIKKQKKILSNKPYIFTGLFWLVLTDFFPMYRISSYIIMGVLSFAFYKLLRKFHVFKDTIVEYEEEISFEDMEVEDVLIAGSQILDSFEDSRRKIRDIQVRTDVRNIIQISHQILDEVKTDPKDVRQIRKFISYYLPTIDKLLKSYVEMENVKNTVQIQDSKRKIESILKTIEKAFTALYDSLYEDDAIDISTDIKVLENVIAQEGLLDK